MIILSHFRNEMATYVENSKLLLAMPVYERGVFDQK